MSDEAPELGTTPSPAASVRPVTPARRAGGPVAEDPVMMRLPSGAVVRVVAVSTRADGILDVPDDVRVAGWWRGGARVGDPFGSTLVAAHVDSGTQGLGPYAELLTARPGARIVLGSAHLTQPFRVTSLRLVARGTLADDAWMYAVSGRRRLTLVTCAGPYDRARGGYQNLAVVTALPAGPPARIP